MDHGRGFIDTEGPTDVGRGESVESLATLRSMVGHQLPAQLESQNLQGVNVK